MAMAMAIAVAIVIVIVYIMSLMLAMIITPALWKSPCLSHTLLSPFKV